MFHSDCGGPDYGPGDRGVETRSFRQAPAPLRRVFKPAIVGGADGAPPAPSPRTAAAMHRIHAVPPAERPTLEDVITAARTDSWQTLDLYLRQNPGPENRAEAFNAIARVAPAQGVIGTFIRYVDLMDACSAKRPGVAAGTRPYSLGTFVAYFATWQQLGRHGIPSFGPAPKAVS